MVPSFNLSRDISRLGTVTFSGVPQQHGAGAYRSPRMSVLMGCALPRQFAFLYDHMIKLCQPPTTVCAALSQWEVSNRALEVLQNTKDAQGRTIEVCKIRLPPPLFRTYKEAEGLAVRHKPDTVTLWDGCKYIGMAMSCAYVAALHPAADPVMPAAGHNHAPIVSCMVLSEMSLCLRQTWLTQADHIEKGYVPRIAGERLPATYINHYTANGGAVVPQFGFNAAGTDERALEDISKAYNGERKV